MARNPSHFHVSDVPAASRLTADVMRALAHASASFGAGQRPLVPGAALLRRTVARALGLVAGLVDTGTVLVADPLARLGGTQQASAQRAAVVAALNGVLGDHLEASANPLALPMQLRMGGGALALTPAALPAPIWHRAGARVLVTVHGLCRGDLQWLRRGHDHGALLARDLGCARVDLNYNSGRHISVNGRAFAQLLEDLVVAWPGGVGELVLVGHSMGGLVMRSACHYAAQAGHTWPALLADAVCIGTPHHGAPLERGGQWLTRVLGSSPYLAPFAQLGQVRSAGITDLRHGNVLDEDWSGHDRFETDHDARVPVPLPACGRWYAIAGTTGAREGDLRDRLLGDGLVPLASALGEHADPARQLAFAPDRRAIMYEVGHLDLLSSTAVYHQLRTWLGGA
jgi:hypothetical protein